jgi:hypothetical protein
MSCFSLRGSIVSAPHSKKNLAQFAGCFITEPGLLCIEFFALLAQLLERITRARFGPGHQISFRWPLVPSKGEG